MWEITEAKRYKNLDFVRINSDYDELVFHDVPILFSGKNSYDDRVVGSFADFNETETLYLHSIVDERTYSAFTNQRITYRELLKFARFLFCLRVTAEDEFKAYWINYEDIPADYLPEPEIKCPPSTVNTSSVAIESRFVGGRSDQHLITPETSISFQTTSAKLIRGAFNLKGFKNLVPSLFVFAPKGELFATGSVKMNYRITIAEKDPSWFFNAEDYAPFIESYVSYCLNHLTDDAPDLARGETAQLNEFQVLLDRYVELFNIGTKQRATNEKALIKNLLKSVKALAEMSEVVGSTDVQSIEFNSLTRDLSHSLGVVDSQSANEVEDSLVEVSEIEGRVATRDEAPQLYRINVYDLNVATRTGRAILSTEEDTDRILKPRIFIEGDDELHQSKYTASLHQDTIITVQARATRIDNTITRLDIEFEADNDED